MHLEVLVSLVFALLSPLCWALMDVTDEYITDHKTRYPLGFALKAGIINFIFGLGLALFSDWSGARWSNYWPPALSGVFLGAQFFFYFWMLKKEDVSNVIGFSYFYPIIVAVLSFLFLGEVLTFPLYLGMTLILVGVALISARATQTKLRVAVWMVMAYAVAVALYEFFIKITTNEIPTANGLAISSIFLGLTMLPALFFPKIRSGFLKEFRPTLKWAFLSEGLTIGAVWMTYLAMANLPATIVSSLQATQPVLVLLLEKIANEIGILKSFDRCFRKKFIAISFIALGAGLMAAVEAWAG